MRSIRLAALLAPAALAVSLLVSGSARADVAPAPDSGAGKYDMASTMAKADMSAATPDSSGCSLAQHGQPGALALGLGLGALGLLAQRRRRTI